uniref:Uncharacterized protein n=1 Tax=Cryptomonas curvata TaxID=233186 RepID=A0A7S0M491_9CRYP
MSAGQYSTSPINELAMKGQSAPLAKRYGVSPKTIRDIWNRRTWAYVTIQLWCLEQPDIGEVHASGPSSFQLDGIEYRKNRGRPKGSRDKKPRTRASFWKGATFKNHCEQVNQNRGAVATQAPAKKFSEALAIDSERLADDTLYDAMSFEQPHIKLEETQHLRLENEIGWSDSAAIATGATDPFHDDWAHW